MTSIRGPRPSGAAAAFVATLNCERCPPRRRKRPCSRSLSWVAVRLAPGAGFFPGGRGPWWGARPGVASSAGDQAAGLVLAAALVLLLEGGGVDEANHVALRP